MTVVRPERELSSAAPPESAMTESTGGVGGWEPGQKADLATLIAYQTGSVVSRTIINRKTGTVTLFAFDEGEGLSEHTSPYDALLQCSKVRPWSQWLPIRTR